MEDIISMSIMDHIMHRLAVHQLWTGSLYFSEIKRNLVHSACNTESLARMTGSKHCGLKPCDGCPSFVLHSAVLVPTKALLMLSWPASVVPPPSWTVGEEIGSGAQEVLRNAGLMNKFNGTVFPHSHGTTRVPSYTSGGMDGP